MAAPAGAQNTPPPIAPPDGLSQSTINAARAALENRTDLNEAQLSAAAAAYDTAETALRNGQNGLTEAQRLQSFMETAADQLEALNEEAAALRARPPVDMDEDKLAMNAQRLSDLQLALVNKEAALRALRAEQTSLRTEIETLQSRRLIAPNEQAEFLTRAKDLTAQIAQRGETQNDPVETAVTAALKARFFYRRASAAALELEIASAADRQEILTARETLNQLQINYTAEEVAALQRLTGKQRLIDAAAYVSRAKNVLAGMTPQNSAASENGPPLEGNPPSASSAPVQTEEGAVAPPETQDIHPLVFAYAKENLRLSEQLLSIAQAASLTPKRQATKRSQIDIIDADLITAKSLIELGNISRASATILRQLRNDNIALSVLEAQMKSVNQDIAEATQTRLVSQNYIRDLGQGGADINMIVKDWQSANPAVGAPPGSAREQLQSLNAERRIILTEVSTASRDHLEELIQLKGALDTLLGKSRELTALLEKNLLWLPSIAAVGLEWPSKVIKGAAAVFSGHNISLVTSSLRTAAAQYPLWLISFILIAGGLRSLRRSLWADIERRAAMVGRVQQDSYMHTPAVLASCVAIALPLAIMFFGLSSLFALSGNPDPFVQQLASSFRYLAVFILVFLTWRAWDRDQSLFDKHFSLDAGLRHDINRELKWFIPFVGTFSTLTVLTSESRQPNVFDGFSLLAFLLTALALSFASYRILWTGRRQAQEFWHGKGEAGLSRYTAVFAVVMMGVPLLCAFFAALGYYETTSELLYRLFLSGALLIGTYVVYGTVTRTILVSKRRLALKQAIERRDKAVKARAEQKAAADRGENPAPITPINLEEIDIESVSRQTEKLLNAVMMVLFAVFMWMIWSGLLPALSFFDNIELGHYMVETMDSETGQLTTVERAISLWNIMQALVIFGLTVLAARNLPGFLEIFALSRLGFDPGTRYAIVTILGYLIFGFGLFMGLDRLGLQWSQLKWIVTGLSVGIGLGLQKIIANFVSGLIILFERPVRIGDYVTIGQQSGTVTRIQIRATTLVDLDNREILIPNEELISQRVTNWTLSNSITRLLLNVGIAYGTDTEKARELMLNAARANKHVLETPAPQVVFTGFGDSSLDFEVRVFLKSFEERVPTRHELHTQINKAFEAEGIEIPFPQRSLHMVDSKSPPAKPPSKKRPPAKPKPA
jgi:potassium efflux system protein